LLEGYRELYSNSMSEDEIEEEVHSIMEKLDIDKSGMIDYTEWAVGTIDKN
jgi:hypothetical protein